MSIVDVIKSAIDSLDQISEEVNEAIVYLDAGCTESFKLIGAFSLLLQHGARAVCCLENLSPCHMVADWNAKLDFPRKVVVMTSCLLSDTHRYTLRCLSSHPTVQQCYIFTSISEMAHSAYPDSPLGPDAYREYELLLIQDYEELTSKGKPKFEQTGEQAVSEKLAFEEGWDQLDQKGISHIPRASCEDLKETKEKLTLSVQHFPMIFCPLSPKCFVLPSGGSVAQASLSIEHEDSLSPGLPPFSTGVVSDGEDVSPGATLTANFLYYLASKMDLKFEIFSFGDVSKTVGRILTDMSSLYDVGRRKRSAGLLLVDRTLDLLTPCCHGDSLFDRMFLALRLEETSSAPTHTKNSQAQGKMHSFHLQRAPLDVRIPLDNDILDKDSGADNFQLLEGLESVLCGWNSSSPDSKVQDLINLSSKIQEKKFSDSIKHLLDGSFVVSDNFRGTLYLEAILDRKMKDGAVLVKRWLQETLRKENISLNLKVRPGMATKSDLEVMIKALAKSDSSLLRNKGIIQLAAGAIASLDESHGAKWDTFISAEKMLQVSAGDTSQSLAAQIGDLINKSIIAGSHGGKLNSSQGLISFNDALLLTIIGYILAGENFPTSGSTSPFSWQEEHLLKEAVVDAIFENPELAKLNFVRGLAEELIAYQTKINSSENKSKEELSIDDFDDDQWGNWGDEESDNASNKEQAFDDMQLKLDLRDRVDNLFRFLHKLSGLKSKNKVLREGPFASDTGVEGGSLESKGLLHKLLTRVLDKHEVPGLEHHSSAVGRLFKSGFGRFGLGQAKPSLADHNVILVFVIGGTNGVEVREAFEALSESGRPDIELIIGGTTLLTPDDMLQLLLGNSSYF